MNCFLAESFRRQPQGHLRWASHCQNCLASTRSLCLEETRRSTQFLFSKRTVGSSRTGHTDSALADLHLKGNSCKLVIWADFTLQAKDSFLLHSDYLNTENLPWKWQYLLWPKHVSSPRMNSAGTQQQVPLFVVHRILPSSAFLQNYSGCCDLPCPLA